MPSTPHPLFLSLPRCRYWQLDRSPSSFATPPFGKDLDEQILVPYPIESPLSGVRNLTDHGYAW